MEHNPELGSASTHYTVQPLRLYHILLWLTLAAIGFFLADGWYDWHPYWKIIWIAVGSAAMTASITSFFSSRQQCARAEPGIFLLAVVGYDYFSRMLLSPVLIDLAMLKQWEGTSVQDVLTNLTTLNSRSRELLPAFICIWGTVRFSAIAWRTAFLANAIVNLIWFISIPALNSDLVQLNTITAVSNCISGLCIVALIVSAVRELRLGLNRNWLHWMGIGTFFSMASVQLVCTLMYG